MEVAERLFYPFSDRGVEPRPLEISWLGSSPDQPEELGRSGSSSKKGSSGPSPIPGERPSRRLATVRWALPVPGRSPEGSRPDSRARDRAPPDGATRAGAGSRPPGPPAGRGLARGAARCRRQGESGRNRLVGRDTLSSEQRRHRASESLRGKSGLQTQ